MSWYLTVLRKYAAFGGRARRKEFWMFVLVHLAVLILLSVADAALGTTVGDDLGIIALSYYVLTIVPSLAVSVRRLHDTGRSGWWLLLNIVPIVGALVILVFHTTDGTPGDNAYGPSPKAAIA